MKNVNDVIKTINALPLTEDDAVKIIKCLKRQGFIFNYNVVTVKSYNTTLVDYLKDFYVITSSYYKEKLRCGKTVSLNNLKINRYRIIHYDKYFKKKYLSDLTKDGLKNFRQNLINNGLAYKTVFNIMQIAVTALKWAYLERIITHDVASGLITCQRVEGKLCATSIF